MQKTLSALILIALLLPFLFLLSGSAEARHKNKNKHMAEATERILLMRHAEKPDSDKDVNLAFAGYTRASNLPPYIASQFGRPDYIFAAADSKHSSRCSQTALPLSRAIGVPISDSFRDQDYQRLAQALTNDSQFKGKLVVVIWHHEKLPAFAKALGARDDAYPRKWKSDVYNQIWELDYVGKHSPLVTVSKEPF